MLLVPSWRTSFVNFIAAIYTESKSTTKSLLQSPNCCFPVIGAVRVNANNEARSLIYFVSYLCRFRQAVPLLYWLIWRKWLRRCDTAKPCLATYFSLDETNTICVRCDGTCQFPDQWVRWMTCFRTTSDWERLQWIPEHFQDRKWRLMETTVSLSSKEAMSTLHARFPSPSESDAMLPSLGIIVAWLRNPSSWINCSYLLLNRNCLLKL